ncbi:nucleotide pyrophosphohydrolase [Alphaproteobacteria bacterium]|nr:nucleotide pyrophosphohydrolase [Alphaproteobacteria bacterium]
MNFNKINKEIKSFVDERDWDQFHSPKNLSMALSVEASELVEIFQWLNNKDIEENKEKIHQAVKEEVVDIFYYVVSMCQKMDINLEDAFYEKMKKNKLKYPSEIYKGKSSL